MYFADNLTFRIIPFAHKNQIIPFGYANSFNFSNKKILNYKIITVND